MKKVSIITPVYNLLAGNRKESFIQMFESVQEQDYSNIEHIIVDGDSKDGTLEMLKELDSGYNNVRLLSEPDTGIYNAFNKGIALAQGEYIGFMNSDDYYFSDSAVSLLLEAINEQDAFFAYSDIALDNASNILRPDILRYTYTIPFIHQTLLISRNTLIKYGSFNEDYPIAADHELFIRLIKNDVRGAYVDSPLVLFRSGGASNDPEISANDGTAVLKKLVYNDVHYDFDTVKLFYQKRIVRLRFIILQILYPLNESRAVRRHLFHASLQYYYQQRLRYYLRFRFILKPLENLLKKLKRKNR